MEKGLGLGSPSDVNLEYYYSVYSLLVLNTSLKYYDFSTYYLRDGKVHGRNTVTMLCHGDINCTRVMHGVEYAASPYSHTCLEHWVPDEPTIERT